MEQHIRSLVDNWLTEYVKHIQQAKSETKTKRKNTLKRAEELNEFITNTLKEN